MSMMEKDKEYKRAKCFTDPQSSAMMSIESRWNPVKKWKLCLLALALLGLLWGCGEKKPMQYVDYSLFDTVTTIVGYGNSQEEFEKQAKEICRDLQTYHRLFDIYEDYAGISNLKTINDQAGAAPVTVEPVVLEFLQDCEKYWELTDHRFHPGMGSLLELWHEARQQAQENPDRAAIPEKAARLQAKDHMDMKDMVLDFENQTVFLLDPQMKLDVGAIAKGWAAQKICQEAPTGMLISVGGSVCATGPKPDGTPWTVGIQNPDSEGYLRTVKLSKGAIATSGDYQRFFEVDGKRYHHIIDPDTTLPSEYWRSVTVICSDAGLADVLSTALFLLPRDKGQALLEKTGAEALWLDLDGNLFESPGFPK